MSTEAAETERILRSVNRFYEENPFPGFDVTKYKTKEGLSRRASWWAHKLDAEIPFDAQVIDVGCGTGQLVDFLGLKGRPVMGVDYSQHSLDLAQPLRDKFNLEKIRFQRENILELSLPDNCLDYVFCDGVLHLTIDAYGGFKQLVRITRPGGFVVVGLIIYHVAVGPIGLIGRLPRRDLLHLSASQGESFAEQMAPITATIERAEKQF